MNEDEYFVNSLRPESTFGSLGAEDDFDADEDEFDQYSAQVQGYGLAADDEAPNPAPAQTTSAPLPVYPAKQGGSTGAAITLFTVAAGAAIGWHFGRVKGAAGGALAGGAVRNLYRTQQAMRSGDPLVKAGSVQQGIIGLLGLGLGGYLMWTANKK